jgi:GNAT superfamily N-acetyltransferase
LGTVEIRELTSDDGAFLGEMLYTAAFGWQEGDRPPIELVLEHPEGVLYHRGWGRPGDVGVVAEEDGLPVGAAWYRLFTAGAHGDGFVDEETPELAVAVREGYRGRGIGTALLHALHERARAEGRRRLSLSVDARNPAKALYVSLGYRDHEPADGRGRMVLELG